MTNPSSGPADPIQQAIADIYTVGADLGFLPVRIDRSAKTEDGRAVAYFEVGYGCREIKVRTYRGDGQPVGIYRCNANKVDLDMVVGLLAALLDEVGEHEKESARV